MISSADPQALRETKRLKIILPCLQQFTTITDIDSLCSYALTDEYSRQRQ